MPIALIVHGGAGIIRDELIAGHLAGCNTALAAGWAVLEQGGSALDACEAAVRVLEDDPVFNAGTGSVLNAVGTIELDAAIMDGSTLAYGAVGAVQHVRNPITLARHILNGPATMLVSSGAEAFATTQGMPLCANADLIVDRARARWERWRAKHETPVGGNTTETPVPEVPAVSAAHDTVGAVALDRSGKLAAANSTGGTPFKLPGRVGDTPLIGCGLYADNTVGACAATGWGEAIIRMALARRAVEFMERGVSPHMAARRAVALLMRRVTKGNGGCILLNTQGQVGLAWNTARMAYAYRVEGSEAVAGV